MSPSSDRTPASGVDYPTLLATMVDTALARGVGLR